MNYTSTSTTLHQSDMVYLSPFSEARPQPIHAPPHHTAASPPDLPHHPHHLARHVSSRGGVSRVRVPSAQYPEPTQAMLQLDGHTSSHPPGMFSESSSRAMAPPFLLISMVYSASPPEPVPVPKTEDGDVGAG
jgi:hypothetical protein